MVEHAAIDARRRYRIRVHVPAGEAPGAGWPLVWLLDGPTTWAPMQQALHEDGGGDVAVIGIEWDHDGAVDQALRRRDFTWPPDPDGLAVDGAAFMALLCERLQPRYLQALPVDPARQTLSGHSLSGQFVLQVLMRRPHAFAGFAAASPSVWWQDERLLAQAQAADWARAATGTRVLVTVGSAEQTAGPEKPEAVADGEPALLGHTHMVDNAALFAETLRTRGIDCDFRIIEGENHRSVVPAAMAAVLRFARGDG